MKSKSKPALRSEEEERAFWEKEDSADHVDWSKAQRAVFPNLRKGESTPLNRIAYSRQLVSFLLEGCRCADIELHSLCDSKPSKASSPCS